MIGPDASTLASARFIPTASTSFLLTRANEFQHSRARADRAASTATQKWCEDYGHVINAFHSQCDLCPSANRRKGRKEKQILFFLLSLFSCDLFRVNGADLEISAALPVVRSRACAYGTA